MTSEISWRGQLGLLAALVLAFSLGGDCTGGNNDGPYAKRHAPSGYQLFASPHARPIALSPDGSVLFVANTTSGTLSAIDTATREVIAHRDTGLDPVALAVRPDGKRLWVANHVSDSVSIFDIEVGSPKRWEILHTIQSLGAPGGATDFDEPVGIAFASNTKAYVALSSTNRIAVIDIAADHAISKHIDIPAQDPRAIAVADGKLYVLAFESNNQTEVSACINTDGSDQCTLDLNDLITFATSPNLPGETKNIVLDPQVTDRDLFVYSTANEAPILNSPVNGVGTLLYGVAVDSNGRAFITHTDARNDANGLEGDNLIDLANVIFRNRVARIDCSLLNGGQCSGAGTFWALEPAPPAHPTQADALATPYGIAISGDDSTLVATAAGSHRIFTMDADMGTVLARLDVGHFPSGVALRSDGQGAPETAYVLNAFDNSVTVVDVSNPSSPVQVGKVIRVGNDPTPANVRRGRIAFNDANAADSFTFSCGSCHPSGNTDQLLWRIGGACDPQLDPSCGDDEPRTTMPIRGLKNTLPLHWDGTLGDPFGGGNGAVGNGGTPDPSQVCSDDPMDPVGDHGCFLKLVEASLAGVMCDQTGNCPAGGNQLSAGEQDDMAHFLAAVAYPPARSRRVDDLVTVEGLNGFQDFFMDQGGVNDPNTCGDGDAGCHELPLGASTNSATLQGFDAPTMRGMTDRFLQFSLGPTAADELLRGLPAIVNGPFVANCPQEDPNCVLDGDFVYDENVGLTEKATFGAAFAIFQPTYNTIPDDIFQMFEEASTGTSGATGRQVTLDLDVTQGDWDLLTELEMADERGVINLIGNGMHDGTYLTVSYDESSFLYHVGTGDYTRAQLETLVTGGNLRVTLTGKLPEGYEISSGFSHPLLGESFKNGITGDPDLPNVTGSDLEIVVEGFDVEPGAVVFLDGDPLDGPSPMDATITCCGSVAGNGSCQGSAAYAPFCSTQQVEIELGALPTPDGTHLIQIQNPKGGLSNELPICVGNSDSVCADSN